MWQQGAVWAGFLPSSGRELHWLFGFRHAMRLARPSVIQSGALFSVLKLEEHAGLVTGRLQWSALCVLQSDRKLPQVAIYPAAVSSFQLVLLQRGFHSWAGA